MQHSSKQVTSIIIVNYNTRDPLIKCLDSLLQHRNPTVLEVIVVDNASTDGSTELVKTRYKEVTLVANSTNLGFSTANNIGIRQAKGEYLLLLNSDTVIPPRSIELLSRFLDDHPAVSMVGPKLLNPDMSLQRSWFNFPSPLKTFCHIIEISQWIYKLDRLESAIPLLLKRKLPAFISRDIHDSMKVDYLLLACLMVRRNVFDKIGLLDENLFLYHEDCELGYRAKAQNLDIAYYPASQVIHLGGSSSGKFKLSSYRSYFRSLVYVVSKHENIIMVNCMRVSIVIGMLMRLGLCILGFYRDINKIGIYKKEDNSCKTNRPRMRELLTNYFMIAVDSLTIWY